MKGSKLGIFAVFVMAPFMISCRSTVPSTVLTHDQLVEARSHLARPLPGDLAALYRLRVASSGGLRLSVLTSGSIGRATISEPFGSAISLTAWSETGGSVVFDLRKRCRFVAADVSGILGVGTLPLPQAVLLLGGRLPASKDDRVEIEDDGRLRVVGDGWHGFVAIAGDPWRVTLVEGHGEENERWRVQLRDHTSSLPGWVKVTGADGRWAELELVRLEWNSIDTLPPEPDLPWCGEESPRRQHRDDPGVEGGP